MSTMQQGFDFDHSDDTSRPAAPPPMTTPALNPASVREPADAPQRRQALDPTHSFVVQAPAGSGKTELLTDRILALLATVERPEEIVAITFTRRAASEMHARVLEKLRHAASAIEPEAPHLRASWRLARQALARDAEKDWQLLKHPARLAIQTIDSFCARLVRSMPWLSELGGMPGIAENAWSHYEAAALETLRMADSETSVRRLLAHMDVDVAAAVEAIASMLAQRDQWMPLLRHGLDREGQEATLAHFIHADIEAAAKRLPLGWEEVLAPAARLAAASLDEISPDHRLAPLRDWVPPLGRSVDDVQAWVALADLLLTSEGRPRSPRGLNKNLGCPPKSVQKDILGGWLEAQAQDAAWAPALAALRELPPARFSDAQWEILEAQWRVLRLAAAQLRVRFAQEGEVDFTEISQRAEAALGSAEDPGELLLKLDASIRHLLIDEFQDTSLSQVRLLEKLTSGWMQADGRTLFLVGDPMQSIYRFRKAEVGLFLQVRKNGIGELRLESLNLTDNFRSQAGVVEWVNQRFGSLLPSREEETAELGAVAYTRSVAFNPALPGRAVRFHAAWGKHAAQADTAALAVTERLVREALDASAGKPQTVAVLVRARTHLGELVRALTRAGIGCRAVELVPLAQRHVVADLVQLVRALVHPGDRLAWLAVLRAPWCGLTLNTLAALFGSRHERPVPQVLRECLVAQPDTPLGAAVAALPPQERDRLLQVAAILLDGGNDNGALPWAAWVEAIWQRLGGARLYAGSSAAEDAESVFVLLEKLAPYGELDVAALDAALARLFASGQPEPGSGPVVEIMTMHKSKGLQFDTVILYGLHRVPRAASTPLLSFEHVAGNVLFGPAKPRAQVEPDPLSRYIGRREKVRGDYEVDRLLYVAATRARQRLHLVGSVMLDDSGQLRQPAGSSLLGRLWPLLDEADKAVPVSLPEADAGQDGAQGLHGAMLQRIAHADLLALPGAAPTREQDAETSGGQPAPVGEGVQWGEAESRQAAIGTLVHGWLTRLGQDGLNEWPEARLRSSLGIMARQLTRAGTRTMHAAQDAAEVLEILLATLRNGRGRWLLQRAAARREWPLLDASGKVSILDLAFEDDGTWLIVDYKTGTPWPDEDEAAFARRMRGRYQPQMNRYLDQVTALTRSAAKAALYFPRLDLWLDMGSAPAR
ncbi:DNA 3'-5' helicase [Kerstersia similis]